MRGVDLVRLVEGADVRLVECVGRRVETWLDVAGRSRVVWISAKEQKKKGIRTAGAGSEYYSPHTRQIAKGTEK